MALDLLVRGGTLIDGTGAGPRRADVGVRDGRIAELGDLRGVQARRLIDAEGAIVTPGFVDPHGHYDGQAMWDGAMEPSSLHGVTTCVIGNCGVGFAPVRAQDRDGLVRLMEGVEDIPGTALSTGLSWDWETFPEYMDALARRPRTLDLCVQVPHDALRVYVMGERAFAGETATEVDGTRMAALLREALGQGAVGFSTGRTDSHRNKDGRWTPAADADERELTTLAGAFAGLAHGVLQVVSDFDMERSSGAFEREWQMVARMAKVAGARPVSISLLQRDLDSEQWRRILARAEQANAEGTHLRVQVAPRAVGVLLGLSATFHPFMGFPSYKRISALPLGERVRVMRDPAFKAQLLSETSDKVAGDGSNLPPLADKFLENVQFASMRIFRFGRTPNYEPARGDALYAEALAANVPPLSVLYDALLEDDGKELLYFPLHNYAGGNLDVVREMLEHPLALVGLGDGGAHVGTICDASYASFFLAHWTRDRPTGRLPIERAVQMLSSEPARHFGLRDRGTLALGQRADVNVIDHEGLGLSRPHLVHDLPADGARLLQRAKGYRATIVAGEPTLMHDELTGARPGGLCRVS
jgi:N-acyl-D-aspartate/D-glutamate deacylase